VSPAQPATTVSPAAVPRGDDPLARFRAQQLAWEPCLEGSTAECASYDVPLDYSNPTGRTISIGVARQRASSGTSQGSIIINPGGPGGSATNLVIAGVSALPTQLTSSFDIVGPDPRGVNRSTRLMCATKGEFEAAPQSLPSSRAERRAYMRLVGAVPARCEELSPGLMAHVGTHDVARDMDILRSILREPKLNYLGISYGTYLGAIYASLFPGNVGRFVLDSNMNPNQDLVALTRSQARGFQVAFNRFARVCAASGVCPFPGSAREVSATFTAALNALNANPLPVPGDKPATYGETMKIVQAGLTGGSEAWLLVFVVANALVNNDGQGIREITAVLESGGDPINLASVNTAVNCFERAAPGGAPRALARAEAWSRFSPTFGRAMAWESVACTDWPVRAPRASGDFTVSGAPAMLLIGGLYDPNTPLVDTYAMQKKLPKSRVLVWTGDGHGAVTMGNACINAKVSRFFTTGRLPADGTNCFPSPG
jgi:pimeloyl-ACP methyl ester carboxylesterase